MNNANALLGGALAFALTMAIMTAPGITSDMIMGITIGIVACFGVILGFRTHFKNYFVKYSHVIAERQHAFLVAEAERIQKEIGMPSPTDIQRLEQAMAINMEIVKAQETLNTCLERAAAIGMEAHPTSYIAAGKQAPNAGGRTVDLWKIEVFTALKL